MVWLVSMQVLSRVVEKFPSADIFPPEMKMQLLQDVTKIFQVLDEMLNEILNLLTEVESSINSKVLSINDFIAGHDVIVRKFMPSIEAV